MASFVVLYVTECGRRGTPIFQGPLLPGARTSTRHVLSDPGSQTPDSLLEKQPVPLVHWQTSAVSPILFIPSTPQHLAETIVPLRCRMHSLPLEDTSYTGRAQATAWLKLCYPKKPATQGPVRRALIWWHSGQVQGWRSVRDRQGLGGGGGWLHTQADMCVLVVM